MTNSGLRLFAALGVVAVLSGCSDLDNCPEARTAIIIDRPGSTDKDLWIYSSSEGWDSFDEYPAKTELWFKHDLGVPLFAIPYLSFRAKADSEGNYTPGSGNVAEINCMDSHTIVLKNDTCERSFFVKVVAYGSPNGVMDDDHCDP
jgi:hypothetical protein